MHLIIGNSTPEPMARSVAELTRQRALQLEEVSSTVLRVTKYDEEDPSDSESASQKDLESEEPATPTCTQVSEESVVGGAADEEATHVMTLVLRTLDPSAMQIHY